MYPRRAINHPWWQVLNPFDRNWEQPSTNDHPLYDGAGDVSDPPNRGGEDGLEGVGVVSDPPNDTVGVVSDAPNDTVGVGADPSNTDVEDLERDMSRKCHMHQS